jgi:diaminohydroxyphosphoribosylaminopyrimidine deaminase / 5-amino-6-(5-phosphoribosylamino)uracil reductase
MHFLTDLDAMRMAIAIGARNKGRTWPNPSVGAVIVSPKRHVIARAATAPSGRPHAERQALEQAGAQARDATLYVTLEPCSHYGKTPPCAEAIVASGIARVVCALPDPAPWVAGKGFALLRRHGIPVLENVCAAEAMPSLRGHITRVSLHRPWVTLKLAQTRGGYAGQRGTRLLITDATAHAAMHLHRAHNDALMVAVGTILSDNPKLNVRVRGFDGAQPVRIVVDTFARTPLDSFVVQMAGLQPTWIMVADTADLTRVQKLEEHGVRVIRVPTHKAGLDLHALLRTLGLEGITNVFSEGGPRFGEALARLQLVDELMHLTSTRALDEPSLETGVPALGPALQQFCLTGKKSVSVPFEGDILEIWERR